MNDALLLALPIVLPGAVVAVLGLLWLAGLRLSELSVGRLSIGCWSLVALAVAALAFRDMTDGAVLANYGDWLSTGGETFPLKLRVDSLSLVMLAISAALLLIVSIFSRSYIHRDAGFQRFFLLLNLFGAGIMLLYSAGSFDFMAVGWELVCTASFLLVAFYEGREGPARGALRVLGVYRLCDVGLFAGIALLHHEAGPSAGAAAAAVPFLFLLTAMGKSAQAPFSGWLPRVMEGPTPSSALFYGALSVHAGAYLLLRAKPLFDAVPWANEAVVLVGAVTALKGALIGRISPDAKTGLAYATMTQLGLIFVEIGLGWTDLALWHVAGHAVLRTTQFLRAPSMLHDHHQLHSAAGGHLAPHGPPFGSLLPAATRDWLYGLALDLRGRGIS